MPRRLLERCQPDSIREFRLAAARRYDDGLAAAICGRRLAAIYLWGYSAEMTIKAAYFALIGLGEATPISVPLHIQPAISRGRSLHIAWPNSGAGHNVRAWAELLVLERASRPGVAYGPSFAIQVQSAGQRVGELWRETLRYHKNTAYLYELRQVGDAAEWLLANAPIL